MKTKIKIYLASLVTSLLLLQACSLDENPTSFVNIDNFYQTEAECVMGLNSCYIPLKSIYTYQFLIITEGVTDLMNIRSGTLDAQLDISPAQPRHGQTLWTQGYKGVMYSNAAIEGIKKAPIESKAKNRLLAEGMILRAYYYWFLTNMFGDIPFYTEHIADVATLQRVAKLTRMPAVDTRNYLIDELLEYVPHLTQTRGSDVAEGRIGAAMGWMMIGKLAQWNKRWDVARDAVKELEDIYGDLSSYPLEEVMLKNRNIKESIFEVQYVYNETGLKVTTNSAAICMPTRNDSITYDGVEIPELGHRATTWTPLRPNAYFFQSLQPRRGADKRKDLNMAWEYNGKPFNSTAQVPWLGQKFWSYNMFNLSDGNNQKVFRYADAILMQAENYMELNDKNTAIKYLNMTRTRAGLEPYIFRNDDALREEIQKERGRELLGEYQRKFDLVRWGIWYQLTYDYTDYGTVKNNILPCHEFYPIPDLEVVYSGYNLDNDAYAAFGL